ncbi:MAG: choice-of-anchor D domain-containing protein [Saprospiraceae bacterium]|nr:choice-of-anchor D domain-containing protein [Saprospiraceae bacterium]
MNYSKILHILACISLFFSINAFANTYTVINTADSGAGSLRQAITDANANVGADTIVFNIPGGGPWSITVSSALPTISGPTVMDGTTQPGFTSGTQSSYVKVGTAFTGTIFAAANLTGLTIKGLDISYTSVRNGGGIHLTNCSQSFILNNFIKNRNSGIIINGGQDHTVQNNDLFATSANNDNPSLYFLNITQGSISGGLAVSGNKFGGSGLTALRIHNMSNLVIGDASVIGSNITIEDNSGLTDMGQSGHYLFYLTTVNNITIDNIEMSWLGGGLRHSNGIVVSNQVTNSGITIKNCAINNRYEGINCTNGKDYTIQNNNLKGTGEGDQYAISLSNITAAAIPGGILVSGNLFGRNTNGVESRGGLKLSNMSALTIGDETTGVEVKIGDTSGFNKINANNTSDRGALFLLNVSNIVVDNLDASWTLGGIISGFGIRINNTGSNGNITIKNCDVKNHYLGIACSDGKDYSIFNNDLRGSGHEDNAALDLRSIGEGAIPGGVLVHSNLYGQNPTGPINPNSIGLFVSGMSNLTIGDATTGVEIKIEDNSGMNTFGGNSADRRGMLYLDDVSNITVDDIDVSYTLGGIPNSFGIYVENETSRFSNVSTAHHNVTIKNCLARNRSNGIRIRGGKDYTVFNNDLRGSGHNDYYSLELSNIREGTIPNGVLVHSNLFGTNVAQVSNSGISVQYMNDLTIGDATTGVEIKIEDGSGFNQISGADVTNQGALYLNGVNNFVVDNLDCSKNTAGQGNSFGIKVVNTTLNSNIIIKDCLAGNRNRGIWINGGSDYTVTNNNLVSSGSGNSTAALELSNIIPGTLAAGVMASGNTFGIPNFNRGVVISGMRNLLIGDASVVGANIILEDNSGLNQCVGADYNNQGALFLSNVDSVVIDNIDCSKVTATASSSYGIYVNNGVVNQAITIKNCKADNRYRGINCRGGKDYIVQNNSITNSGWDTEAFALDFRDVTAGTLTGGVLVSGNTFGNVPNTNNFSRAGVRFDNMSDLTIGDATTGTNVKLEDGNGLSDVGFEASSSYAVIALNNVRNSTIDNLDISSSFPNPIQRGIGIKINNSIGMKNVIIKDCNIQNRRTGIYIIGGRDYTITGNNFTGSGIRNDEPAVWLNGLLKESFDGGIAMSGNTFGGTNANTALRVEDMRSFTIGDNVSDDIFFDDVSSGLTSVGNNANSNESVLFLAQVSNVTINGLQLSKSGGTQLGGGLTISNGSGNKTISITNNSISNRRTGIQITGGVDYTITGNILTASGLNNTDPGIYLNGILEGSLVGGISMSANFFGGTNSNCAVRFDNMKNLTIGDASVGGRNITFEDVTSGLDSIGNNGNSNEAVLFFNNVSNASVDNVDLTRTGATQKGIGIRVDNNASSYPFAIKNCAIGNRRTGIYLSGGKNYTVQNNNLTVCGSTTTEPALYILNAGFSSGKSIYDNTFGGTNFNYGLRLDNINDVIIGDNTVAGVQIELLPLGGIKEAAVRAIHLETCNRIEIELVQLSLTGGPAGTGLYINGGSHVTAKSLTIQNRVDAIDITSGFGHTVECCDLSSNTDALQVASGVTGLTVEQNTFVGNTGYAIQSAASIKAENNYFGGGAPPVGDPPNAVTASVDFTPFLGSAPSGCPSSTAQEIELIGNLNLIEDGSVAPTTSNFTDFSSVKNGSNVVRTFTINNIGGAALNITSIGFSGTHAADFVAGALTPASPIPPGSSATFNVTFTPGATGLRTATLDIVNDDADEAAFDAAVQGTGKDVILVTNTNNTGVGSLRQAITDANANADADVIEFAIGSGAQMIVNTSALPTIIAPLMIDGSSQPGFAGTPLITINSNSSFTSFSATTVTGLTIKYLDISRPDANYDGYGVDLTNCNEVFILNNIFKNRFRGVYSNGGRDHTIKNNDFRRTGVNSSNPAIYLNNVTAKNIPNAVDISGNLYGDVSGNNRSSFGIRISNMSNLLIGDASVVGANFVIEDGSGMASTGTGDEYCLYLQNVSNITMDNLDFTATTYGRQGGGIRVQNGSSDSSITIKNCIINNRYYGINCSSGRDYTIQNNYLKKTGNDANRPSLWLNSIIEGSIPRGILMSGNVFGDAANGSLFGIRIDGMNGLLIGNQTVVGAHITLEDTSGLGAAGTGDNYVLYLINVSNTTINKVNLNSIFGYQGWGIVFSNNASHSNNSILNCKINTRYSGIYCSGGKDYTITGNDLRNTGNDNNRPALYLSNVRPGNIPAGITANSNLFGFTSATTNCGLRLDNMDGLLIGDAGVVGANIVIEDNSGMNSMNNSDLSASIYLNGVSNIMIDNVDVSRSAAGRDGTGIYIENSGSSVYRNNIIKNCKINQRTSGIWISGGKDVTIKDNDLRYSGYYTSRPGIYLNGILAAVLPGGIDMSGNLFGGSFNSSTAHMGIRIDNMRDLIIGNTSVAGRNITIEDNSGMNNIIGEDSGNRGCLYMNNTRNVQIKNVDLSKATAGQGNSFALWMNNGNNTLVQNCKGSNRYRGFQFTGGRDYTVLNNDLDSTGVNKDDPALWFSGISPQIISGGVSASGNTFGGPNVRTALRMEGMKNIIIGDASVVGAHVVIEDNSGMNNLIINDNNSNSPNMYLTNMTNTTVDNIDASRPGAKDRAGIWVANNLNNYNVTIKNCNFNNLYRSIYCSGGRDYIIKNNTMLNSGWTNDQPSVYLQHIQSGNLPGGIDFSGNKFGGSLSRGGLRCENMRDLIIGDLSIAGRNITLEDTCGLNNMGGNGNSNTYYVLHLVNVKNTTVDNLDLSRPIGATPAQDFTGIRIDNGAAHGPVILKNCDLRRHKTGINIQGGKDYTITNNDLRASGVESDEPALYVSGITQLDGSIPMGLKASANQFGWSDNIFSNAGIRLENLCGIKISNFADPANHIVILRSDSLSEVKGISGSYPSVITLRNTSGVTIDSIDLSISGTQTGTGIYCANDNASQYGNNIQNNLIKNRRLGIRILNGSDYTIQNNDFQKTGIADDEPAIRIEHAAEGSMPGGVSISGNKFGGTGSLFGLKFVKMSNLKISDGTFPGTNVNLGLYGTNGLSEVAAGTGYVLHLSDVCNSEVNTLDLSRSGIVRQGTGIRLSNGVGNTIQKVYAQGRDIGLQVNGSKNEMIKCNTFYDNNFGMDFITPTISTLTLINNSMMCNATGLRSTAPGTLNAMNNYWGAANGPSNLGGTGNGYTGTVDATSFLTNQDACAPALPNTDVLGNALLIEDEDITPSFNDNTLVCGIEVGEEGIVHYGMKNNGSGIIRLIGPAPVTTVPSTEFTVFAQPADLELFPGDSTTVSIKFAPTSVGLFSAVVNIANYTCNNNPYNFTVQGNGCDPSTAVLSRDTAVCIGNPSSVKITITGGMAPFNVTLSDGSLHVLNSNGVHYISVSPVSTTNYTLLKVIDANNCCADLSGSSQTTINALPTPTIVLTETSSLNDDDGIICANETALLDAGVYTSWSWSNSASTQTISVNTNGTYTVTVTDANGCSATDTEMLTVLAIPTPSIAVTETSGTSNNDGILCAGENATLDAGVFPSWVWSTSATTQSIMVNTANTYSVTVTDANACTGSDAQIIIVNPLPAASLSDNLLVCPGTTSVQLNINVTSGTAPLTVMLSDGSSHNVTSIGVSQITVTVSEPGPDVFTITSIEDANGCSGTGSGMATVDFGSIGEIEISGNATPIMDGDNMPDLADHTDFGQTTGAPIIRTFTITNSHGSLPLNISGVNIVGSTEFSLETAPSSPVSPSGGTTTFQIKYTPSGIGIDNAVIEVSNSDCDENPYNFAIMAEQNCSPPSFTACPNTAVVVNTGTGICTGIANYIVTANGSPAPTLTYVFSGATTGSGSGTGTGSSFGKGNTTVTVTATNPCGAPTCVFTVTVNDSENPVPTCESAQTILLDANCKLAVPDLTDGATATDNCSTTFTWTQSPTSATLLSSGEGTTHTVTVTANDGNGNSATCTVVLTGNDNTNPVPSCETAQTINLNSSCQLLVPDLTDGATATDNCSTTFTWTQSPTSATLLPSGEGTTHTITVTANDGNGNSATCTVVLTGDDTTAPIPDCENNQTLSLNANCEITVPDKTNAATASDNCSISFTWTQNPLQGAMLPSGEGMMHVVTVTVSDGNGNSSTCTSVLTGNDNANPVPTCETAQTINLNASCELSVPQSYGWCNSNR